MRQFSGIWLTVLVLIAGLLLVSGCALSTPSPTAPTVTAAQGSDSESTSIPLPQALTNSRPTLAEFGRGTCIPCQEMKPILDELAVQYRSRLNVSIVSVDDYRQLTNFYKVMAIPTQIGFDSNGKEVFRHVGFWPKDQIISQLRKLGIQ
jgi:thioredoxin 1